MEEFVINQHVQDCFLRLASTNTQFLKLTRTSVPPNYFSSEVTETLVKCCFSYFDQFQEAPIHHLYDEMLRKLVNKEPKEVTRYTDYLRKISEMHEPSMDYILSRINEFVKARSFENAAIEFVTLIERNKITAAKELMYEALKVGIEKEDVGLTYFNLDTPTYLNNNEYNYLTSTGVPTLDKLIGGYKRGEFVCILGGYKGKKSWSLIKVGEESLMRGLNVLHISHEMNADEIEMRYDMAIGGLVSDRDISEVQIEIVDDIGNIENKYTKRVENVYNKEAVFEVRKKLHRHGGNLIIKKYPMRTGTMSELDRYLDYLETYHDFIPDVVLNDYADIMLLPKAGNTRDSLNTIYMDHKRLADERNMLVITVSQVNREALSKEKLTMKDIAEDARKVGNVDVMVSYSQTDTQEKDNIMRGQVIATRSRKGMGCGCLFKQNLDIGQFCTGSWFPQYDDDDF